MLTVPAGAVSVVFQTVKFEEPQGSLKLPHTSLVIKCTWFGFGDWWFWRKNRTTVLGGYEGRISLS